MEIYSNRERELMPETPSTASFTECTGLMPTPPLNDAEAEAYKELYSTALPKSGMRESKKRVKLRRR